MTCRIAAICLDANDPARVAEFWCEVLGWTVVGSEDDIVTLGPADGSWPTIDVVRVPEAKTVKNRLHLDLRADATTNAAERRRLERLGARPVDVGQDPDATWTVLTDPEGNEFCLLLRTVQEVRQRPRPERVSPPG